MYNANHPSLNRAFAPFAITRPEPVLLYYYALVSLIAGPAFIFVLLPLVCKYLTLRYQFDEKGISTSYGVLFKRETLLTYRRIQDIHLTHNIVQRWLGLATVSIQTASGTSGAEMAIEGILEAEELRDFLYKQMRGARGLDHDESTDMAASDVAAPIAAADSAAVHIQAEEITALLREIRDALIDLSKRREGQS